MTEGPAGLGGVVAAVQEPQPLVGKCLDTHAHAVDGQCGQTVGKFRRHVIRVAFHGDLRVWPVHLISGPDAVEKLAEHGRRQQRRRAATDVDGLERAFLTEPHLPAERIHITLPEGEQRRGVKTAIDTSAATKWNMYV